MDIIVTVPKSEIEHFWEETDEIFDQEFWNIGKVPRKLEIGDYIYFVVEGKCVARAKVNHIEDNNEQQCEWTDRFWSGCQIFWNKEDFEEIEPFEYKGFQGFRYFNN